MNGPDRPLLTVVRGAPTPADVAALTLVICSLAATGADAPPPAPSAPAWPRRGADEVPAQTWVSPGPPSWQRG